MGRVFRSASFLPACILGGVGMVFAVLLSALPPLHVFGLTAGTAATIGFVVMRLGRGPTGNEATVPAAAHARAER